MCRYQRDRRRDMTEPLHRIEPGRNCPMRVARHLRDPAPVDADRRQDPARADAVAQSFLACPAVRHRARADHVADSVRRANLRDRVRFHRSRAVACATSDGAQPQLPLKPQSVAEFYAEVMAALARARHRRRRSTTCRTRSPDAIPFARGHVHASYDAGRTRSASGACCCAGRPRVQAIPRRLHRQVQPGAFLLGQLRSRGDALFRPPRAAASGRRSRSAGRGRARSLFARGAAAPASGRAAARSTIRRSIPTPIPRRTDLHRRASGRMRRSSARISANLCCPYDAVRSAPSPDDALMEFLQSTYEAAADNARWDRAALECVQGKPGRPRPGRVASSCNHVGSDRRSAVQASVGSI